MTTMRRTAAYYGEEGQYPQQGEIVRRGQHPQAGHSVGRGGGVYDFHGDGDPHCEHQQSSEWRDASDHCTGHYNPPHPLQAAIDKYNNYKGSKAHVPIMNNTWIHKDDQDNFHIRHHQTDIMSVAPNGDTTVNLDGWNSATTAKRLHAFLPRGTVKQKNPSRAQGAAEHVFHIRPGGGSVWGHGEERGKFGLHPQTQTHTYEDGFSFNAHSGEVLPEDHVRPTSDPVRPPKARGTLNTSEPTSNEGRGYFGQPGGGHFTQTPDGGWGRGFDPAPYVPPTPMHEQESTHEQIHRQLRSEDRSHPGRDSYGDGASMEFSHHTDLPSEGESFDDWMERTTDKPKNVPCGDCKGRGSVRKPGPVPEGVNPWEHKKNCDTCGGDGLIKNSRITRQGSVIDMGALQDRWLAGIRLAAYQTIAYGETKAPDQVDTLREEKCPVCGEADAYDGDQCQVCGFVTPPAMFQDPDLDKAKMMDLRNDPASGAPNDQDHDLPPVDPDQVDEDGAVEGEEAGSPETQDDGTGIVDVETRGLGDDQIDPNAEPGEEQEPVDPEDLNDDGVVSPEEAEVAEEQAGVDQDAEEVKAEEDAEDGSVSAPVDPDAAAGHVNQGGEPFTPGPNAPSPGTPMEPDEGAEEQEGEQGQSETGQDFTTPNQVPGEPGDGIADLLCPSCGFSSDAATPTSTPGSPAAPANEGDGALAGDVCPQCQGATLMSTGEIQELTGAPR